MAATFLILKGGSRHFSNCLYMRYLLLQGWPLPSHITPITRPLWPKFNVDFGMTQARIKDMVSTSPSEQGNKPNPTVIKVEQIGGTVEVHAVLCMVLGLLFAVGGIIFSVVSVESAGPGQTYIITYGIVIVGIGMFIGGLRQILITSGNNSEND